MPNLFAQKITPFLWFDANAEEAARFYTTVFRNSRLGFITRYGDAGPAPKGTVMTVSFELEGVQFTALNGGPHARFNEAVSFVVACDTQAEIDEYWEKLTAGGGQPIQCGWLKDRFGLAWQIVPANLFELLKDPDKSNRVMVEVMKMIKLDKAAMEAAAAGA
ncbi:MAG: putative 3-demethylubiquinone-9 3-methyltransferase [Phycisphaerae bacterium]